jgi:tetratricopeptide (TPR) repeat protein
VILRSLARAAALCALVAPLAIAQAPRLGTITFPTSGAAAAQEPFMRGVLYLHSFEFGSAGAAFREAQQADAGFALAYWGEAMSYNHPLWDEWDDDAARGVLERLGPTREARRAKAPTPREQLYLDAVERLWADGPKPVRDTAYALAMEQLVRAHPDDDEARAFWALSILGLSGATRVVPSYMRGAAIAQEVFERNPDHPGAAHYIIHSFDDPVHAPLGLPAARAYSTIAPDAAHAQHMTTHIFLAMGMWDDVVSQNEIAAGLTGWGPGHYTSWLGYGLVQQGRHVDARAHLERARREMGSPGRPGQRSYLTSMRAHFVLNTERWSDSVLAWSMNVNDDPDATAIDAFVLGYAALRRGDRAAVPPQLARLQTAADSSEYPTARVLALNLAAAIAAEDGAFARTEQLLKEATGIEDSLPAAYGPPDVVKPSWELLGELLLAKGRAAEAQTAFTHALAQAPKRALSLRGLVAAATAAGDRPVAERARQDLAAIWHAADDAVRKTVAVSR